jgi:hypothetical protein
MDNPTTKPVRIPDHLQGWITARKRHRLSHAQAQMARELGMNPKKLGKLDNADQEPWKLPLPAFIESLYQKRFGTDRPDVVNSIEEHARLPGRGDLSGRGLKTMTVCPRGTTNQKAVQCRCARRVRARHRDARPGTEARNRLQL